MESQCIRYITFSYAKPEKVIHNEKKSLMIIISDSPVFVQKKITDKTTILGILQKCLSHCNDLYL